MNRARLTIDDEGGREAVLAGVVRHNTRVVPDVFGGYLRNRQGSDVRGKDRNGNPLPCGKKPTSF